MRKTRIAFKPAVLVLSLPTFMDVNVVAEKIDNTGFSNSNASPLSAADVA